MIIKSCKFHSILIDSRCFRKGILLQLTTHEGKTATTEISPLPGFSVETLDQAYDQLQKLTKRLLTTWWTKPALHYLETLNLYPSVYFGVESALLDLLDPIEEQIHCPKYALLCGSYEEILLRAEEVYKEGLRKAKIKLGHFTLDTARQLIDALENRFKLRLDLNRKWNIEDTLRFCQSFPKDTFEYIEEPARDPNELLDFSYPFALDETLREKRDLSPFLSAPSLKALILKPTLIYPLTPFLSLGPNIVLTSSFESGVGIGQIERLAFRLQLLNTEHGLDTLRYFENTHESLSHCLLETTAT